MRNEDLPADAVHLDEARLRKLDQGRAQAAANQPATDPLGWMLLPPPPPPRMFGTGGGALFTAAVVVAIGLAAVYLVALYRYDTQFQNACTAAGGRVHSFSPHICVTPDGRIMEL